MTRTDTTDATGQVVITFSDLVEGDELQRERETRGWVREAILRGVIVGLAAGVALAILAAL